MQFQRVNSFETFRFEKRVEEREERERKWETKSVPVEKRGEMDALQEEQLSEDFLEWLFCNCVKAIVMGSAPVEQKVPRASRDLVACARVFGLKTGDPFGEEVKEKYFWLLKIVGNLASQNTIRIGRTIEIDYEAVKRKMRKNKGTAGVMKYFLELYHKE